MLAGAVSMEGHASDAQAMDAQSAGAADGQAGIPIVQAQREQSTSSPKKFEVLYTQERSEKDREVGVGKCSMLGLRTCS